MAGHTDAMTVRAQWMRLQGVPVEVIAEQCDPARYPADLADELENLQAIQRIRQRGLSDSELAEWARVHQMPR